MCTTRQFPRIHAFPLLTYANNLHDDLVRLDWNKILFKSTLKIGLFISSRFLVESSRAASAIADIYLIRILKK